MSANEGAAPAPNAEQVAQGALLHDGLQVAQVGVKALQTVIDNLFGSVDAAIPAVGGDVLAVALSTILHVMPANPIGVTIASILQAGGNAIAHPLTTSFDSAAIALLAVAKARVDSYLQDIENKL